MAFVRQRNKTDCGIAALAMLCDVSYEEAERVIPWRLSGYIRGTDSAQLRAGGSRLGYYTESTPQNRLKPLRLPKKWIEEYDTVQNWVRTKLWLMIPDNSLVKIRNPESPLWHWVVVRKGAIYDPARGVFKPEKYDATPSSYMQFISMKG
jgi:hypothetical protein